MTANYHAARGNPHHQIPQQRPMQYTQAVEDAELQALMAQVVQSRKAEKDYKNIED